MALEFAGRHQDDLRYCAAWHRWMRWDGARWRHDQIKLVFSHARALCRERAVEQNKLGQQRKMASAATVAAVERLSQADQRLAATIDQWDADPWLMNTPGGIVDLRTGDLLPHDPTYHCTKITAVAPGGDCPLWQKFLTEVLQNDRDLIAFVQRACGYALTGDTREHAMMFFYGKGANGKGVMLNTIAGIMADYARTAPIETFVASNFDNHPTDLASLAGARLAYTTETEEGRAWAEAKIKGITGGDKIAARFMRQDFFEYTPQFKLVISGNHRPRINNIDEAMRRRINLIPFEVTIPPEQRDPDLAEKLKAEWPGILAWMTQGCLDWQRDGLQTPERVRAATAEYLEAEDSINLWLEECCKTGGTMAFASTRELWKSWREWCDAANERSGTQRKLTEALKDRGFNYKRTTHARGFDGITVLPRYADQKEEWLT